MAARGIPWDMGRIKKRDEAKISSERQAYFGIKARVRSK